jgi:hypothetical protein
MREGSYEYSKERKGGVLPHAALVVVHQDLVDLG